MLSSKVLIQTLSYFDIFSYPMTLDELAVFLVGKKCNKKNLQTEIEKCTGIQKKDQYYFLSGREELVPLRKMREEISKEKKLKAEIMIRLLRKIPTIEAIALSGSVACKNARPEDDIDLFFIVRKNSVWISRFFVYFLLRFTDSIRSKKVTTDRFCPNMFVSEDRLYIQTQNVYTASEISHLVLLFERRDAFSQFMIQNNWLLKFFPNYQYSFETKPEEKVKRSYWLISLFLFPFEFVFFLVQFIAMHGKITNEKISFSRIQFHPEDLSSRILRLWRIRQNTNLADKSIYYINTKESLFFDLTPGS